MHHTKNTQPASTSQQPTNQDVRKIQQILAQNPPRHIASANNAQISVNDGIVFLIYVYPTTFPHPFVRESEKDRIKDLGISRQSTTLSIKRCLQNPFYDNRDNNDNGKNGRNGRCHEVTYNRDNKITVVNLFFRKLKEPSRQLVN